MVKKNLFIVDWFVHGGAEREMYEFDLVFKKNNISLDILSLKDLSQDKEREDFFYPKHRELGTPIYFFYDVIFSKLSVVDKIKNRLFKNNIYDVKKREINHFIKQYTNVYFMGEYVYKYLEPMLEEGVPKRKNVFIMSFRFQGEYFRAINKNTEYNFISGFSSENEVKYEFEGFKNYNHLFFQLNLEVTTQFKKWKFNEIKVKKTIAIFTRLSSAKPLDPFFYALHLMLLQGIEAELYIYGGGDASEAGYKKYIANLGLNNNVFFKGHSHDIKQSVLNDEIDLVWYQGYLNKPAGYAGFDIALTGTPQLFWDFYNGENILVNNLDCIYPHFKDMLKFVEFSMAVLTDKNIAESLSEKQFNDVYINRNMDEKIQDIKHLFE